ncbi:PilZ domain-containing protein [Thiocystis violacea]|uniref:PilZ domain-containing protein n=1 Tax=Thiocystis violacea TaxID=13725 RepID=UPI001908EF6E|nr:PilZ domain-containing protein [Thiocystis violacea]
MTIEHRYCARYPIALDVHIQYRKRRFYGAKGTNLSTQGMFLEVRNLTLPTGTMIELELHALGRDWLIPAIVIHRSRSGIGAMFRDPQPELFLALPQLAHQRARQPTRIARAHPRLQA